MHREELKFLRRPVLQTFWSILSMKNKGLRLKETGSPQTLASKIVKIVIQRYPLPSPAIGFL
jgi:hypothetical protein